MSLGLSVGNIVNQEMMNYERCSFCDGKIPYPEILMKMPLPSEDIIMATGRSSESAQRSYRFPVYSEVH
jgi:hypothetical protein